LRKLCAEMELAANDVPDAWLAATVINQGEHLVSFDADFRRLLSGGPVHQAGAVTPAQVDAATGGPRTGAAA
jgi:hypothetical protein